MAHLQDVEVAKLANKEEQHDMELRETKRQMEDKIREVKIDSASIYNFLSDFGM